MRINVIIPTYKPGKDFLELLKRLAAQSRPAERIIIMNTEEKYFDSFLYGTELAGAFPNVQVHHLSKWEFDHGGTRNAGASRCDGDIFICMTQDALPADSRLIEELAGALEAGEDIAAAYARQLPAEGCTEIERYTRAFNYPPQSRVKGREDLPELGIKTYFCSNVCAAYRKDIFDALGGFERHTIFNEDMIYAGKAVQAGYRIAYAAGAQVYHSHNYSSLQQFKRNFDNGVSQAQHPEVFAGISSESEGLRLMKETAAHLCRAGRPWLVAKLCADSAAKYAGFWLGKHYKNLPEGLRARCSMNGDYWKKR